MYSIRQEELFSFEEVMKMTPVMQADILLEHVPMDRILHAISGGPYRTGRPEEMNTRAMIYSLFLGKIEHIRFTKDLVRRLKSSHEFRVRCRFTGSDRIPSEASYSRLIARLSECGIFEQIQVDLVRKAKKEGFLSGERLAMDSSHVEAFERNPCLDARKEEAKKEVANAEEESAEPTLVAEGDALPETPVKLEKPKRDKRGRVPKAEEAAWREEVAAYEASLGWFEKEVIDMLPATYEQLLADMPQYASIGAKGDPRKKGNTKYWYGHKLNVLVDCQSQYIVAQATCSAHVNDQRMAILLLKQLQARHPEMGVKQVLADKGYDCEAVYRQIRKLDAFGLIPLIHRNGVPEGVDKHFRPLCKQGNPYVYDSYDAERDTVKFTSPKECATCPFQADGCQKVFKFRVEEDVRKYTAPGRGSKKFAQLYKQRVAVERVFAYLKLYLDLGTSRRRNKRGLLDVELSCLTYNLCKLSIDCMNKQLEQAKKAA